MAKPLTGDRGTVELLSRIDLQRLMLSPSLASDPAKRAKLGQFFTPVAVAALMGSMIAERPDLATFRILDAGSGNGMLTAAAVSAILAAEHRPKEIIATAWEIDAQLTAELDQAFTHCRQACHAEGIRFVGDIRRADFIGDACRAIQSKLFCEEALRFDLAILNPPYRKLSSASVERARLSAVGIETSNLYAAFLWLAMNLLDQGGQLIAITPRSYMNGSYFKPFRAALLREMRFDRIHVYETRDTAFGSDDVLQENAIISARKGGAQCPITVTTSESPADEGFSSSTLSLSQFVRPDDPDQVMHVIADDHDAQIGQQMRSLAASLEDLRVSVSTGRIVDFRARERLRERASNGDVPMIFPRHIRHGFIAWPLPAKGKADAIEPRSADDSDLLPSGWYVIVKRFSAKEEKRRVVAALLDPAHVSAERIGFDNKLNVLHFRGEGLPEAVAKGLAVFLNSTIVDAFFRQFSGHTQVNAADLRSLRFPDKETLKRIGSHVNGLMPDEDIINQILQEEVPDMAKGIRAVAAKRKVEATIGVLKALNAPKAQCNERSALTLLALLDLSPTAEWSSSSNPRRGVTEIMDWMAATYRKEYAPNTRETIRRFTLHQLIVMGLVILNPDDPGRPPNSPKNVYQVEPSALELLQTFGTDDWAKNLSDYLDSIQGKNRLREAARSLAQIPVQLPDGRTLQLTGGGQNVLIKEIIEQFAPRFTPGGHLIYVGDAGEKHLLNDEPYLAKLGVTIDRHGKMPDVVIHFQEKNWLVLVEAVTSHGPVNLLRHTQLKDLFTASTAGLVFVTAFLDRQSMREYLPEIAWETEVWVADAPDHLIHFNGSRFLGPYGGA